MSESKFCADYKTVYHEYSVSDFIRVVDYIQQQEAIDEAIRLDNPPPSPGAKNGSR